MRSATDILWLLLGVLLPSPSPSQGAAGEPPPAPHPTYQGRPTASERAAKRQLNPQRTGIQRSIELPTNRQRKGIQPQ